MRGVGFLAIWSDVEQKALTDYRHWLTREHTTERVTTKGFLAVRVFRAERSDTNRFFILYELEAPEVLDGPAYLARLNAPTPWSQRIMPQLGNFIRGGGVMAARAGRGEAATIAALRLEQLPDAPQALADALVALDGIAAVQIGATDQARTSVPTVEKGMRQQEGFFAGLLIIEALDERLVARGPARGGRDRAASHSRRRGGDLSAGCLRWMRGLRILGNGLSAGA